jgi:hypothetical protein
MVVVGRRFWGHGSMAGGAPFLQLRFTWMTICPPDCGQHGALRRGHRLPYRARGREPQGAPQAEERLVPAAGHAHVVGVATQVVGIPFGMRLEDRPMLSDQSFETSLS